VADAVGTTTRAVYSVFGSKAGLLAGLAARGYDLLTEQVRGRTLTDDPLVDLVEVGLQGFRRFASERPHLFRLTFERMPADLLASPSVARAATDSYEALAEAIERAMAAGSIARRPVNEVALAFHALCEGLAGAELSMRPPPVGTRFWRPARGLDLEDVWRTALTALLVGLPPTRGASPDT
jgi:AcrR family transcriptional regulator